MANYKLNEARMFADITDGVAIIINSETGIYFGANAMGTAVIENLFCGSSVEDIALAIKAHAGAPSDVEEKLSAFVQALLAKEIIVGASESTRPAVIAESVFAEGFEMTVNEFSDAQELLLADPIHEVKEDIGWMPEMSSINPDKDDVARREAKMQ